MRLGLNVFAFNWLDELEALGLSVVRHDIAPNVIKEFATSDIQPILLITEGTPEEVIEQAEVTAGRCNDLKLFMRQYPPMIEIINEPTLVDYYKENPDVFAATVNSAALKIRRYSGRARIIVGAIHNTNKDGLRWLGEMSGHLWSYPNLAEDPHVYLGFHSYHLGDHPSVPHDGYDSREHEIFVVKANAYGHQIICTEFGRHNAIQSRRKGFPCCFSREKVHETEVTSAEYIEWELKFFHRMGVHTAIIYQHRDGSNPNYDQDNYGIYRIDNTLKPIARNIARIAREVA